MTMRAAHVPTPMKPGLVVYTDQQLLRFDRLEPGIPGPRDATARLDRRPASTPSVCN